MRNRMLVLSFSVLLTSACAFAASAPYLEFTLNSGGTVLYSGGSKPVFTTGVGVSSVVGKDGTPTDNGQTIDILDGTLTFNSGANTGPWTWNGPGDLTLDGCLEVTVTSCTGYNPATPTVLVDDVFSSVAIEALPPGNTVGLEFSTLTGTLNSSLTLAYGVSTNFQSPPAGFQLGLVNLPTTMGSALTASVTKKTTTATGTLDAVSTPEDRTLTGTLGMFSLGLALFCASRRLGFLKTVEL